MPTSDTPTDSPSNQQPPKLLDRIQALEVRVVELERRCTQLGEMLTRAQSETRIHIAHHPEPRREQLRGA